MMLSAVLALMSTTAMAQSALAVKTDELHLRLNEEWRKADVKLRMTRKSCGTGVNTVCNYGVDSSLVALASSPAGQSFARDVTVISQPGDTMKAMNMMLAWLAVSQVVNPEASKSDRADLIMSLMKNVTASKSKEVAELGAIRYTADFMPSVGFWFSVERVK